MEPLRFVALLADADPANPTPAADRLRELVKTIQRAGFLIMPIGNPAADRGEQILRTVDTRPILECQGGQRG